MSRRPLADIATFHNSKRIPLSKAERAEMPGPYPYYGATSIVDHVADFLFDGLHVLVGEDGSVIDDRGRPVLQIVDGKKWVNNHAHVITAGDRIDTRFLYYSLATVSIDPFVTGAVQPKLSMTNLKRVEVPWPERCDRESITAILGALDDKIDLNHRMNETLEAMARAIFKSWFVDFDPVRAKAEGRQPFGMDSETAALFPDRLVESELGETPEGWEVATLGALSSQKPQYGYTTSGCEWTDGPRFLRIADINKTAWIDWASVPGCTDVPSDIDKYRLMPGDLVIARMADPGHSYFCTSMPDTVFASYLIRFRPMTDGLGWYLGYWTKSPAYWALVNGRSSGSTRANLNAKVLSSFPVLRPGDKIVNAFREAIAPLRDMVDQNCQETITLAKLRDLLLPRLVSGEIRVKDAEKAMEAVP